MNKENRCTTDGRQPREGYENASAPAPIKENGQHEAYWILCEEERNKGFIRPVRNIYVHIPLKPKYPLRDLTDEEHKNYDKFGYYKFETYLDGSSSLGKYWTEEQLNRQCGIHTTMGQALSETYARNPKFYGGTFCVGCGKHFPVGEHGEFYWVDKGEVTSEKVGT